MNKNATKRLTSAMQKITDACGELITSLEEWNTALGEWNNLHELGEKSKRPAQKTRSKASHTLA